MHCASRVHVTGPLEPYAAGFDAELARLGYTPLSAVLQLRLAAHLSRHMTGAGLPVQALTERAAGEFLAARRAAGYTRYLHPRSLGPLLGYLRRAGAAPAVPAAAPAGPAGELLAAWQSHLAGERGLAAGTRAYYVRLAGPFLAGRAGGVAGLKRLTSADVTRFMVTTARGRSPDVTRHTATALRSLLRFLHVNGLIAGPLAQAVPAVARRGRTRPGKAADAQAVAAMLAACDRGTIAAGEITPSSPSWPGSGCVPGKSPGCAWTTWTGTPGRSSSEVRAGPVTGCRCRGRGRGARRLPAVRPAA